jgi:hypothetical protein
VLAFLADGNFDRDIADDVRRRYPGVDIVRVQDVGLTRADDPAILAWAAGAGRLLLTHDIATVTKCAYERTAAGLPMPGVVEVAWSLPVGLAIEEILLLAQCSGQGEWEGQILYLPL